MASKGGMSPNDYDSTANQQHLPSEDQQDRLIREQEWQAELAKLEEDIATLKSVLDAKVREAAVLKKRLGITPIVEIKDDFKHGIQVIRDSGTYQKTNAAFKSFGAFATKKIGEMRNSNMFKSVEEKVGGAYSSIKHSQSMGNMKTRMGTRMQTSRSAHDVAVSEEGISDESYSEIGSNFNSAGTD